MQIKIKDFDLGTTSAFDEGVIATHRCFCCMWKCNKDNAEKLCINFFVMANSTHYFVKRIDVYQVNMIISYVHTDTQIPKQ